MTLVEILINDRLINELSSPIDVGHTVDRAASAIRCIEINQMVAHEKRRSALLREHLRETAGGMNIERWRRNGSCRWNPQGFHERPVVRINGIRISKRKLPDL